MINKQIMINDFTKIIYFRYARVSTNLVFQLLRFQRKLGDAGIQVPAPELHTRPGYINTCLLTGLEGR